MVSIFPPTSKSSSPFNSPLVTLPNAPITISIIVTFMFHSFLIPWQGLGTYPFFTFFHYYYYYYFTSWIAFHSRIKWLSSTGVWVTVSLLKSSGPLLSFLASVFNNLVVWMAPTRPLISNSSSLFTNPLVTIPSTPISTGISVTFMFHSFFQFPHKIQGLIFLFTFFQFNSVVSRDSKVHCSTNSLFLVDYY